MSASMPPGARRRQVELQYHLPSKSGGDLAGTPKAVDLVDPASPYLISGALSARESPTLRFPGPRLFFFSSFTLSQAG